MRVLYLYNRRPRYVRNLMLRQALRELGDITELSTSSSNPLWGSVSVGLRYLLTKSQSFDLIVVGFPGQLLVPWIRLSTRVPILFDPFISVYDTLCFDRRWFRPRSVAGRLAFAVDRWSCRWADQLLTDTRAHGDYFVRAFDLPPAKLNVVYVGCDEDHFFPRPRARVSRFFEVFIYTSFLRLHGIEYIVRAAERLSNHPDIVFTIAGDGAYRSRMEQLADHLGLKNVRFPGWISFDRLPDHIAEAHLCLGGHFSDVAKARRVIATKTFQFLAMGKPTIVGDTLANREVMTHGRDAYFCPVADAGSLAEAVLKLRGDPALRRQLGENGMALYRQRFTVSAVAQTLRGVLSELTV